MPAMFDEVWVHAMSIAERELGHQVDSEYALAFTRGVIEALGFSIANNGEIVDPRPAPVAAPPQQNVRFRGRRRR